MALRTNYNPFCLNLALTFSDFEKREGRGRPQTNPYVTLDLSAVSGLVSDEGEKRIRNEAFKLLRNQLGIDAKAPIVERPGVAGVWVIKDDSVRSNVAVVVTAANPEADNIFG